MCQFFFFFFQAEDGIRDTSVTGVQTCALPISLQFTSCHRAPHRSRSRRPYRRASPATNCLKSIATCGSPGPWRSGSPPRSEERRVGEEGRARGAADKYKKKRRYESEES